MVNENKITKPKTGAVILAGGHSSRMGFPKPWLKYNDKESFLMRIVHQYVNFGIDEIVVILNHTFYENWHSELLEIKNKAIVVKNLYPEKGRNYSLQLAFKVVENAEYVFLQNVDNPFVSLDTLQSVYNNRICDGYVSPIFKEKGGHPILLSSKIIEGFTAYSENENLKMFLNNKKRLRVTVSDANILKNINTPEAYEKNFLKLKTA